MKTGAEISFVIPAYNCADTVADSVASVIHGNFESTDELIIVNDCSTDATVGVLAELRAKHPFIKLLANKQNKGCPATRNTGIEAAQNPLIFNLDSDNILVSGSIAVLRKALVDEKADVAAFAEYHFFQKDTNKVTHKWICNPGLLTLADFLAGAINPGPGGNFLFTKESWQRIGRYWEYGAGLHEAWGFSLKQIASGSKFIVVPNTYYFHRYGHDSLYARESRKKQESSLMATKMIMPFIYLIDEEDAQYITSECGSVEWFDNIDKRPIRVKSGEIGRNGKVIQLERKQIPKQISLRAGIIGIFQKIVGIGIKLKIGEKWFML